MRDPAGNFPRQFRALQKAAAIRRPRRFHELRAAFTTAMIQAVGLSRAADLVGHTSVEQTRKYDRKAKLSLVAEAVLQLRGEAGDRQVDGAKLALAHGCDGPASQLHTVIILGK